MTNSDDCRFGGKKHRGIYAATIDIKSLLEEQKQLSVKTGKEIDVGIVEMTQWDV